MVARRQHYRLLYPGVPQLRGLAAVCEYRRHQERADFFERP